MCATPEEEELFKEVLLPFSQNHESFVLISYVTNGDWLMTLNHELLHAQYFKDENFRKTVDEFWNEKITKEDKEKIKTILGVAYNKNDEFLIRNEFQAFLLGAPASLRARQVLRPTLPVEFKTSTFSGAMFWFP